MDNIFFDNEPAHIPPWEMELSENETAENYYGDELWPHVDQNEKLLPEGLWRMFQAALYVLPAHERTSATVVWPRSHLEICHKLYEESKSKSHYRTVKRSDQHLFLKEGRRVPMPPGGLLLWNSRLTHQGWNEGPRLAVPVCLEPKARRPPYSLELKEKLIKLGGPSTHWASMCTKHFNLLPEFRESEDKSLRVVHRAHHFLFGDLENKSDIAKEVLEML